MIVLSLLVLLASETSGVDATPIIVAIIAALGGAGGVGWITRRSTNRKLEAEGENLYQQALSAAERRGQEAVATVDNIRRILEERLDAAERELAKLRAELVLRDEQIRRLEAERDAAVSDARREREAMRARIDQLEETVEDLRRQTSGRRRRDHTRRDPTGDDDDTS